MADRWWCVLTRRWGCLAAAILLAAVLALLAVPVIDGAVVFAAGAFARQGDLGGPPDPWMVPSLERALRHPVRVVRLWAAQSLVSCTDPGCTAMLQREAVVTQDPGVWAVAAYQWPNLTPARRDLWQRASASQRLDVRLGLGSALAVHGEPADEALCLALSHAETLHVREASMACLAHLGTPGTVDRLSELMHGRDPSLLRAGLAALPSLENPAAPTIFSRYVDADDNALLALERSRPTWADEVLVGLALNPQEKSSGRALGILMSRGAPGPRVLQACEQAREDRSEAGRARWGRCERSLRRHHRQLGEPELALRVLRGAP